MVKLVVIKPKELNVKQFEKAANEILELESKEHRTQFKKTIDTWAGERPRFNTNFYRRSKAFIAHTLPVGSAKAVNKWIWADLGTRAHTIVARRAPMLVFKSGFDPKTKPGKLASYKGRRYGDTVRKRQVKHPGNKPRKFSETLVEKRRNKFPTLAFRVFKKYSSKAF